MGKVLITGANGFIGSHIVKYFCEQNIEPVCLVREKGNLKYIKSLPIAIKYGDITDYESLINAFQNIDFVIHTAAFVKDWGSYSEFYKTNVLGTLNVLKACKENQIKNIILMSSNSVYGEENCKLTKDENSPISSHYKYFMHRLFPCKLNYYRDTKALSKIKAIDYAKKNHLNLVLLEPVWVYGEKEFHTGFYEYLKTAKSKTPFVPGSKKNFFHVIYAGDVARAFFLAYEKKLQGIHSFIIANQKAELMEKIYKTFCKEAGFKKPKNIPKFFIYPMAFIVELFYAIFKIKTPPLLTRGRVNMFYDNIEFSPKKAKEVLGFENEYSLEKGIKKTVNWYKKNNLI